MMTPAFTRSAVGAILSLGALAAAPDASAQIAPDRGGCTILGDLGVGIQQVSGVAGPTLQDWVSDRFNVVGGVGLGFWSADDENERGLGLILGAAVTVVNRGKHNLQVGFEYAPAFTEPETIQNLGITFGYQFL